MVGVIKQKGFTLIELNGHFAPALLNLAVTLIIEFKMNL